jgi:hypothetical protein
MVEPGASEASDPTDPDRGATAEGPADAATTGARGPVDRGDGPDAGGGARLVEGARVEVRNRLDGTWARGFEIAEAPAGGYRLRRLSDRTLLPVVFGDDEVRPERERRRGTWWY